MTDYQTTAEHNTLKIGLSTASTNQHTKLEKTSGGIASPDNSSPASNKDIHH